MDPAGVTYLPPRRTYSFNAQWEHDFLFVQGTSGALCLVCGTVVTSVRKFNVERHYKSAHAKEYAAVTGDDRVNLVNMLKEDLTHQQQEVDLAASLEAASSVAGAGAPAASHSASAPPAGGEGLPNGASKRAKLHVKSEPPDFEAEDAVLDASAAAAVAASYPAAAVYSPGAACLAPDDDEFAVVGRRLAFQLRAMREDQRLLAEKIIGDVMYYGRVGRLTETCFQFLPPT
ncbi:hypothetical protein R5R35_013898 [Gryllus longicercus]|uniref:SPIN-DOC-like zinc-finger domain-containing protein n=1 Tax=Gryllus longicercus TaxID=2509291 RepID=A0AAN9W1L3_9ORTH